MANPFKIKNNYKYKEDEKNFSNINKVEWFKKMAIDTETIRCGRESH